MGKKIINAQKIVSLLIQAGTPSIRNGDTLFLDSLGTGGVKTIGVLSSH